MARKKQELDMTGLKPRGIKQLRKPIKGPTRAYKSRRRMKKPNLRKELEKLQKALVIAIYGKDCYTCPATDLQGSNCQLGHVPWPRSILSVPAKFSIEYTRIQCMRCNVHHGGMGATAYVKMQQEGNDMVKMWSENKKYKGLTFNNKWFLEKIENYKQKLAQLSA